jgi:hypothetical protein
MAYEITITRNTTVKNTALQGYRLSAVESDEPVSDSITQRGPVWNNHIHLTGTFATMTDACRAICNYVDAPHTVTRTDFHDGTFILALHDVATKTRTNAYGETRRVIARKAPHGVWIAA